MVDHLSELLFCSDKDSENNLKREGLGKKAVWVGDVMYDTFLQFQHLNDGETISPYGVKKMSMFINLAQAGEYREQR